MALWVYNLQSGAAMTTLLIVTLILGQSGSAPMAMSYAEFMQWPAAQREAVFRGLSPDSRAAISKRHLEIWLMVHQPDLSRRQAALVREVIAEVTPQLYAGGLDAQSLQRQDAISSRLACSLSGDLAATLTDFSRPPARIVRSWRQAARDWIDWFVNCAL
jgi:hypothetical protein